MRDEERVAQPEERRLDKPEVGGSIPSALTGSMQWYASGQSGLAFNQSPKGFTGSNPVHCESSMADVAQLVEPPAVNREVAGSSPAVRPSQCGSGGTGRRRALKPPRRNPCGFDPRLPQQDDAPVAQPERAPVSEAGGPRFESWRARGAT